jgi:uncharacterized membrane protein YphA (DoxX/SURF4 family)
VKNIPIFVLLRVLIGGLFIVSGLEKLLNPYQNFLYAIQGYELLSSPFDVWMAKIFPWIEFFIGLFVFLGFWLKGSLTAVLFFFLMFITAVGQALLRKLPVTECGCFGGLITFPLWVTFIMDIGFLVLTFLLKKKNVQANELSLDRYLSNG